MFLYCFIFVLYLFSALEIVDFIRVLDVICDLYMVNYDSFMVEVRFIYGEITI